MAPGLPPGHSFFAYGVCYYGCERVPRLLKPSAMGFSEIEDEIKWWMAYHMHSKHNLVVGINDVSVVVYSATSYDAPESEQKVHTEDPSAAAPAPWAPARRHAADSEARSRSPRPRSAREPSQSALS